MAEFRWVWVSVLVALQVGRVAAQTTTTVAGLPDYFNGYYVHLDGTTTATDSITCEKTKSWGTSGTYGNCCQTTSSGDRCPMPTACVNNTVHFDDDTSYTCGGIQSCASMTVYQTAPFGLPSAVQAFCWEDWTAQTVYRELPSETGTASAGSTASAPTATSTSTDGGDGDSQSSNKGWIAGVVVGPVVGVALAAFGLWYGSRKMQQAKQLQMTAASYEPYGHQPQPAAMPMQQPAYAELDSAANGIHQKP